MNPNHILTYQQALDKKAAGGDPFAGVSTEFLLGKQRTLEVIESNSFKYGLLADESSRKYMKMLREELSRRPHLSNKRVVC